MLDSEILDQVVIFRSWGVWSVDGPDHTESDVELETEPVVCDRESVGVIDAEVDVLALVAVTVVLVVIVAGSEVESHCMALELGVAGPLVFLAREPVLHVCKESEHLGTPSVALRKIPRIPVVETD